jgi:hypothetical protein
MTYVNGVSAHMRVDSSVVLLFFWVIIIKFVFPVCIAGPVLHELPLMPLQKSLLSPACGGPEHGFGAR